MSSRLAVRPIVAYCVCLALGLVLGIAFQRYYGVGQLARAVAPPTRPPVVEATPTPTRIEVPFSQVSNMPADRVMVALALGQSNSANHGGTPRASVGAVYNLHQGRLYQANDPLLGASGRKGSVWTRLGELLWKGQHYDAVIFITIGETGSHLARWTPTGDLHARVVDAVGSSRAAGLAITHVLWHQGEADAGLKTTRTQYRTMFGEVVGSLRQLGVVAPVYVSVATVCGDPAGSDEIRRAQLELVDSSADIHAGPNTDVLGAEFRDAEHCHFNDRGLEEAAQLWLEALVHPG